MIRRSILLASVGMAAVTLAKSNDTGAAAPLPPAAPTAVETKSAPATETKVQVFAARKDLPIPEKKRSGRGGGKSPYPFDTLEVGESFGVAGKTKTNFGSIIYGANQRHSEVVKNEDGTPKTEVKVRMVKGEETRKVVEVRKPLRVFEAFDVDPKTDPEGASVRIFRMPIAE